MQISLTFCLNSFPSRVATKQCTLPLTKKTFSFTLSDSKDIKFSVTLGHLVYNFFTYFTDNFAVIDTGKTIE